MCESFRSVSAFGVRADINMRERHFCFDPERTFDAVPKQKALDEAGALNFIKGRPNRRRFWPDVTRIRVWLCADCQMRPPEYFSCHIRTRLTEKFVPDTPDILRSI